jgi:uncharacterized protein (UPF0276 family)
VKSSIAERVWRHVRRLLRKQPAAPLLLEWDNDFPLYPVLAGEVVQAEPVLLSPTERARRRRRAFQRLGSIEP